MKKILFILLIPILSFGQTKINVSYTKGSSPVTPAPTDTLFVKRTINGTIQKVLVSSISPSISPAAWKLTGNSGTTAGINFVGTSDSVDFVTKTNGIERVRVLSNGGNVGIGTALPKAKLHISEGLNTAVNTSLFRCDGLNTDSLFYVEQVGFGYVGRTFVKHRLLINQGNGSTYSNSIDNNGVLITQGIETFALQKIKYGLTAVTSFSDARAGIQFNNSSNTATTTIIQNDAYFGIYNNSLGDYVMAIDNAGEVGIGITNPNAKLEVSGVIVASSDLVSDNSANGLVLKSPNDHYWRLTISNIGVITWTDIGTTRP